MPKEMLPVVDRPVIQYVVEEAVRAGLSDILIVTGRGKRAIEDHFDHSFELESRLREAGRDDLVRLMRSVSEMARIHYVRQAEPRGLGDAVLCAERFVGSEPFAVLLGDDILVGDDAATPDAATARLVAVQRRLGGHVLGVMPVAEEDVSRYGIVAGTPLAGEPDVLHVRHIVEKPSREEAPSRLGAVGRYVLDPEIFDILRKTPPGRNGELQLTDALEVAARSQRLHAVVLRGARFDVGSAEGYLEANVALALRRPDLGERFAQRLRERLDRTAQEGRS